MRKIIFLIACLFCTLSCNNSVTGNIKEKRTQAQPKEYHGDKFGVSITSDRKDTRTTDDIANNLSPKYEITNTILFGRLGLYDGDLPYGVDFEIKKNHKRIYGRNLVYIINTHYDKKNCKIWR